MLVAEWRRVLLAAKAARAAAYLGPRAAARAAAAELERSPWEVRIAVACILASQAAKTEFLADLRTFRRELEGADAFRVRLQQSARATRAHRRAPPVRDRLPVDAAKAIPILELFQRYGHQLRRAGAEWVTVCPFHDDRRPSLRVNATKNRWYCDVCATGGDGIAFVMQHKGIAFEAAVREMAA